MTEGHTGNWGRWGVYSRLEGENAQKSFLEASRRTNGGELEKKGVGVTTLPVASNKQPNANLA